MRQMRNLPLLRWMRTPSGKNILTFLVFLFIAFVLWVVQVMSEETQRDLRCRVEIVNVPDSLTRITPMPPTLNVSLRARGTDLVRYEWFSPAMTIDYRNYHIGNRINFGEAALKSFFRERIGKDAIIQSVTPDTLSIYYTDRPGVELPVKIRAKVVTGPQYALIGNVRSLTDSVMVYGISGVPETLYSVPTEDVVLNDLKSSRTIRVALELPQGLRAVPDSVDIHVEVEPLVSKIRKINITSVNVPAHNRLITVPGAVEVYYMVPMSKYKEQKGDPVFKVEADYASIKENDERVAVTLTHAPKEFVNVYLATDSVDFIIEQR